MSYLYDWKVSNGDKVLVEYCYSCVTKKLKVVDMTVNGKFHRWNWMSNKGRDELMSLLIDDYNSKVGVS